MCNTNTISQTFQGFGLVATGRRSIRSGHEYAGYFDLSGLEGDEITLVDNGNVIDTISRMKKIVNDYQGQTKRIAQRLKGSTREATARNIWSFLYNHVQYKIDNPEREQLRTPVRTWNDRREGVDCDCYSIFISSVLTNLGIPHAFRIAKYEGDYQHVYVIVPRTGTDYANYITIDPVVNRFNYEVPPSKVKDFTMKTTMLNGFGACDRSASTRPVVYAISDQLTKNNLVSTAEVLAKTGVPFKAIVDEENNPVVMVETTKGTVKLPTVITADQAVQLKAAAEQVKPTQESLKPTQASILPSNGIGLALGVTAFGSLLYWAFSSDKPGLSGPPKKRAQKKLKVLHVN